MKKLLASLFLLLIPTAGRAITYQAVRASTDNVTTPTMQTGTMNLSSGTIQNANFPILKSTGTQTLSGTLNASGTSNITGTVTLGAAGKAVTVSSNAVLSGALIANGSPGSSGNILTSNGSGTSPSWNSVSSDISGTTITWTAQQTFSNAITISSTVVLNSTQGTAGQSIQSNAGSAPTWVNVPSAILATTSTWTANQTFSSATATNFLATASTITRINSTTIVASSVAPTSLIGTTTNNNGLVGAVGEYIEGVNSNIINLGTSDVYINCSTVTLTAGDWDLTFYGVWILNGAVVSEIRGGISVDITANSFSDAGNATNLFINTIAFTNQTRGVVPAYRVSLSATTSYYSKMRATYSGGPPQTQCRMSARRMR